MLKDAMKLQQAFKIKKLIVNKAKQKLIDKRSRGRLPDSDMKTLNTLEVVAEALKDIEDIASTLSSELR